MREVLLDGHAPPAVTLAGLCNRVATLTDAAGAAIELRTDGDTAAAEASDALASRAADLQATLGEGPSVDALRSHGPVLSEDLSVDKRWPELAAAAAGLGVGATVAVPLLDNSHQLGALTVYLGHPQPIDGATLATITRVAHVLTGIILSLPVEPGADNGLARAVSMAAVQQGRVHQAAGIISVDESCSIDDALVRLRAYAYAHELLLTDVATAVIDRGLRLR